MNTTSKIDNRFRGVIRWKGVAVLGVATAVSTVYVAFFADGQIRQWIEETATRLNGAKVSVGSFRSEIFRGKFTLANIEIANPGAPMRNLFQIDRIEAKFSFEPILRKKLIINQVSVDGISYGSQRLESGVLEYDPAASTGSTGLFDRVASGLYTGIHDELNDNPLRFLGQLSTGLNAKSKVDSVRRDFLTEKAILDCKNRLNVLLQDWEKLYSESPSNEQLNQLQKRIADAYLSRGNRELASVISEADTVRTEIVQKGNALAKQLAEAEEQAEALRARVNNLDATLKEDVAVTRKLLGLPRTEFTDLTPQVFGPRLLGYLERVGFWVDFGRRQMPSGNTQGEVIWGIQPRDKGAAIHFGKLAGNPALLIKEVVIRSSSETNPAHGNVEGRIEGITTDPSIYQKPLKAHIRASFPSHGIKDFTVSAFIDHTTKKQKEEFVLSLGSYPLEDWIVTRSGDLGLKFKKAVASGEMRAVFGVDTLDASWNLNLKDVSYGVASLYKQAEELVRNIVSPIYAFELTGKAQGSFEKPTLSVTSTFGRRLAGELQREFKHQLAAIDDNLTKIILDQVEPQKVDFMYRYNEVMHKFLAPLGRRVESIQELSKFAAQTVTRLEKSGRTRRQ